jgi:hypothetical protein|tara:strand:- start:871 stop:1146 length:276 start_codon:yes stop_codon:yes gene_type:complete
MTLFKKNKNGNYVGKRLGFLYLMNNEVAIITRTIFNREYQLYVKFKRPRIFWLLKSSKFNDISALSYEDGFPSYEDYNFKPLIKVGELYDQ